MLAVGGASAATTVYPAGGSSFTGGPEGWTPGPNAQKSVLGGALCVEGLTCPTVADEFVPNGGADGTGYLQTHEGGLLSVGLLAESSGTWESPAFTYGGAAGRQPTEVRFSLARRSELEGLLALPGAEASYTAELVDESAPTGSVVVTDAVALSAAGGWKTASASVAPSSLTPGHSYKVKIVTTFVTPAAVLPAGGVAYDDVRLSASRSEAEGGSGGNGGSDGGNGSNGGNGTGGADSTSGNGTAGSKGTHGSRGGHGAKGARGARGLSSAQLRGIIASHGLVARARLHRGWVVITGKCPKAVHRSCTVRLRGMVDRRRPATVTRRARIRRGGRHHFIVAVRHGARAKVRRRRRILVKEWVRAGHTRVTLYRRLRLLGR